MTSEYKAVIKRLKTTDKETYQAVSQHVAELRQYIEELEETATVPPAPTTTVIVHSPDEPYLRVQVKHLQRQIERLQQRFESLRETRQTCDTIDRSKFRLQGALATVQVIARLDLAPIIDLSKLSAVVIRNMAESLAKDIGTSKDRAADMLIRVVYKPEEARRVKARLREFEELIDTATDGE